MLAELIAAGHRWPELQRDYTLAQLKLFSRALGRKREAEFQDWRTKFKLQMQGFSLAISNALDMGFSGGKGDLLNKWLQAFDDPPSEQQTAEPRRVKISPATRAFFDGAPVKAPTPEE